MLKFTINLVFLFVFILGVEAQKMHFIGVFNDTDHRIGSVIDQKNLPKAFRQYAELARMSYEEKIFAQSSTSIDVFKKYIEQLNVGANDAICFFYSGHGVNYPGSQLPAFSLGETNVPMQMVADKLKGKNPRLLLSISDACNRVPNRTPDMLVSARTPSASFNSAKLFAQSKGSLVITSSVKGTVSYGSPRIGGFYTTSFLNGLLDVVSNSNNPTWAEVTQKSNSNLKKVCSQIGVKQTPYIENRVSGDVQAPTVGNTPSDKLKSNTISW